MLWTVKMTYNFKCLVRKGGRLGEAKASCVLVTGASNTYWLTAGRGLMSLQQVRVEGVRFYFFCFLNFIHFPFSPDPLFHFLYYLFYLFSLSLGDDIKWPTSITKTCLYNVDPHKPHFYIVKLGFTMGNITSLISAQNIDCGYSLEPPHRGGSNEYPQSMIWAEIWKISEFLSENFHFLVVKFSVYLNRLVFIMSWRIVKPQHNQSKVSKVNRRVWRRFARLFVVSVYINLMT